ncbi:MAG TPA: hypothetical protein VHC90_20590 [Bryobacteraceae bacterium]|nr:hypothetical protein [Bryobacteraceae bacterium]
MIVSKIFFFIIVGFSFLLLASVTRSLLEKRVRSALMTLRVYLILLVFYAAIVVATTLALPIQTLPSTAVLIKGEWTIDATSLRRTPHGSQEDYEIDFRMTDRGRKPVKGESLQVYLLDDHRTRFNPAPQPSDPPFTAEVKPGKYLYTTRKFVLPANEQRVVLVFKEIGFRWEWFMVGGYPIDGRTVIVMVQPQ